MSEMEKAVEIPLHDCGLKVTCGRDGTWLQFTTKENLHAAINIDNHAALKTHIIGRALRAWCAERQAQAASPSPPAGEWPSEEIEALTKLKERIERECCRDGGSYWLPATAKQTEDWGGELSAILEKVTADHSLTAEK